MHLSWNDIHFITIWESYQRDMFHLFLQSILIMQCGYHFHFTSLKRDETTKHFFMRRRVLENFYYPQILCHSLFVGKPHRIVVNVLIIIFSSSQMMKQIISHTSFQFNSELDINKPLLLVQKKYKAFTNVK